MAADGKMRLTDVANEELNNPNFNRVEFDTFKNESGENSFVMTPQKWIAATNAIGITSTN